MKISFSLSSYGRFFFEYFDRSGVGCLIEGRKEGTKMRILVHSRGNRRILSLAFAIVALHFITGVCVAEVQLATRARLFAEDFMSGAFQNLEGQYTADMKAAMTRPKSKQLREALLSQHGPLQRIGDVWFEDKVQGYFRYRVPLHFQKTTLDIRLVFDGSDRVAGMFFVEHSEPPRALECPYREFEVVVGDDGKGLPGTITLPDGEGPFSAAVLIHGSGPNDRDETVGPNKPFRDLAWGLAGFGIATLRYDKRSFARPGDLAEARDNLTVKEEVIDDALAALVLMRGRAQIDPNSIFVIGHSLGGALAPRIASFEPHPTGVVVLAGNTLPLPEKMLEQTEYISRLDGVLSEAEKTQLDNISQSVRIIRAGLEGKPVAEGYHLGAPLAYYRDLEEYDAPAQLAALALPCLILQGGRDYQVTLEDYALWSKALSGYRGACLRVFENLDHLFRAGTGLSSPSDYDVAKPLSPEVIDCVAGWIRTQSCCVE
ncbi:MAG: alpha/beta fold hydrolase [Candidatus Krumholzibacteria bacterium]|nr:alpha/beta fold hydrolase [Candidatus Krumholzibacteria bacterium]